MVSLWYTFIVANDVLCRTYKNAGQVMKAKGVLSDSSAGPVDGRRCLVSLWREFSELSVPPGITMCYFHVITDLLKFSFWYTGNNVSVCKV